MIRELAKALRFKDKVKSGKACLGAQIAMTDPAIVEILARAGYDWLIIDTEHSIHDTASMRAMLQAATHTESIVVARPLRLDSDEIRRFLDLGAQGILCPFINTGEEAQRFVEACRYPPAGIRGFGPRRAGVYGFDADEYFKTANQALVCIPIIESQAGVENIEAIVAVDGIDGVTIGPMDLSISLGAYKQFDHPKYLSAIQQVTKACHKFGKAMGTGCYSLDHAKKCVEAHDVLLIAGGDDTFLASESRRWLEALR
jgi:2-keto-3-deoxy-L-rhamnonate aldolase RhmA